MKFSLVVERVEMVEEARKGAIDNLTRWKDIFTQAERAEKKQQASMPLTEEDIRLIKAKGRINAFIGRSRGFAASSGIAIPALLVTKALRYFSEEQHEDDEIGYVDPLTKEISPEDRVAYREIYNKLKDLSPLPDGTVPSKTFSSMVSQNFKGRLTDEERTKVLDLVKPNGPLDKFIFDTDEESSSVFSTTSQSKQEDLEQRKALKQQQTNQPSIEPLLRAAADESSENVIIDLDYTFNDDIKQLIISKLGEEQAHNPKVLANLVLKDLKIQGEPLKNYLSLIDVDGEVMTDADNPQTPLALQATVNFDIKDDELLNIDVEDIDAELKDQLKSFPYGSGSIEFYFPFDKAEIPDETPKTPQFMKKQSTKDYLDNLKGPSSNDLRSIEKESTDFYLEALQQKDKYGCTPTKLISNRDYLKPKNIEQMIHRQYLGLD